MLGLTYPKWLNFLFFQSIWFAAILGQASLEWLIVLLLATHLLLVTDLKRELWIILPCVTVGVLADTLLTLNNVLIFDPAPSLLPIPLWLVGIWLAFAGTLRHSMSYLMKRPVIAIAAAAIAAPLSYFAGMRLGAVSFGLDILSTALLIGALWAGLMAIFIWLFRFHQTPTMATHDKPSNRHLLRSSL